MLRILWCDRPDGIGKPPTLCLKVPTSRDLPLSFAVIFSNSFSAYLLLESPDVSGNHRCGFKTKNPDCSGWYTVTVPTCRETTDPLLKSPDVSGSTPELRGHFSNASSADPLFKSPDVSGNHRRGFKTKNPDCSGFYCVTVPTCRETTDPLLKSPDVSGSTPKLRVHFFKLFLC
ncbi:MAG: hypothetical protein FMNOHCHN_00076 [Ignavibacteriaceae bacterium]|nr:hypothetical protein [Ignavibacteriaceae bacterium]